VAILALIAVGILLGLKLRHTDAPPVFGMLTDFSLVTHRGVPITLASLKGRPFVADFIFTRCVGACPAMTARMARLQREVPKVRLLSFTVDPGHDKGEVLTHYAETYHAGPDWLFVTGSREVLYSLATGGFKLAAMEMPPGEAAPDGPFLHSSKFVLVDSRGRVRGYYDSEAPLTPLFRDLKALEDER